MAKNRSCRLLSCRAIRWCLWWLLSSESLELLELLEGSESLGLFSVPILGGGLLSPPPSPPATSSVVSLFPSSCSGGSFVFSLLFSFSGTSSTSGLSDGSGASDLSDRRSEYRPSGSFPFLSSSFSFSDSWMVSWNRTPIRRVSSSFVGILFPLHRAHLLWIRCMHPSVQ